MSYSTVEWPGTQSAVLLQWTHTPAGADREIRQWQLVAQVNDDLIVNVVAAAPVKEFDKVGLTKIMETFRPHA